MAVRRTAPVDDRELFAQFPFLPGAARLLDELAPSVGALIRDPTYDGVRTAARGSIRSALDDPTGRVDDAGIAALDGDARFLAFQYARLLLSAAPSRAPLRRWAVAQAKSLDRRLGKQPEGVVEAVAERLGHRIEFSEGDASLDLTDYLRLGTAIREAEFRLVRQAVAGGRVTVTRDRAVRLLEEGVRLALSDPVPVTPAVRGALEASEREFLAEIAERMPTPATSSTATLGPLRPELFPPCIRGMRRTLQDGENLSHAGRFALAAFLHRVGASFDGIVDSYRGAPDFDESITRYQVEHITRKEEGRGYEPPDCATIRTHGLCLRDGDPKAREAAGKLPDPLCQEPWLKHPMQYYRIRTGGGRPPAPTATPPPAAEARGGRAPRG